MRAGWTTFGCALVALIVLAACGGSSGGGAPPGGDAALDDSAGTGGTGGDTGGTGGDTGGDTGGTGGDTGGDTGGTGGDTGGAGGDTGGTGGGGGDTGGGEPGDGPVCKDELCFDYCVDKELSYVLVSVPCPDNITGITVIDLDDPTRDVMNIPPNFEPSAAGCADQLIGYKLEDLYTSAVRICVHAKEPMSADAVTIQLKYGQSCEVVNGGAESCSCKDGCYE